MKGLNLFTNGTLKAILVEMCRRANVDPNMIDFKEEGWFSKVSYSEKDQDNFKQWMIKYLTEDKKRINDISKWPRLVKNNKRELEKLVDWFIFCYGFRVNYNNV